MNNRSTPREHAMMTRNKRQKVKRPAPKKRFFHPAQTANTSANISLTAATPSGSGSSGGGDGEPTAAAASITVDMDITTPTRTGSQHSSGGLFQRFYRGLFGRPLRLPIYYQDEAATAGETLGSKAMQALKIAVLVIYTVAAIMPFVSAPDPWVNQAFLIANAFILLIVLPIWGLLNGRINTNNRRYIAPYFVWTVLANMVGHPLAYQFGYYDEPSYGWPSLLLALQTLVFWFVELFYVEYEKSKL